jgi:hypothetical protein
LACHDVADGFF